MISSWPRSTWIVPPNCQCQSSRWVPNVASNGLPSMSNRNSPGVPGALKGGGPVHGSVPKPDRLPVPGHLDLGDRIRYRHSESVGQYHRRSHLVHVLLIDHPPPQFIKSLRLDEHRLGGRIGVA